MGDFSISKKDMLEIMSTRDADVSEETKITAVTLTEDAVVFSLEEKAEEEAAEE